MNKFIALSAAYKVYSQVGGVAQSGATTHQMMMNLFSNWSEMLGALVEGFWQPQKAVKAGAIAWTPSMPQNTVAICEQAGTTGGAEPDWSINGLVNDNTAKWKLITKHPQELPAKGGTADSANTFGGHNAQWYIDRLNALEYNLGSGTRPTPVTNRLITRTTTTVKLNWRDPDDAYVDGYNLFEWASTTVVKKQGSYPENVNDGVQVVVSTVRNQYLNSAYVDTQADNSNWYYRAFPCSKGGLYSESELNRFGFWHYAFYIDEEDPIENTCVHKIQGYDNYFLDDAYMDFNKDVWNWGGWQNVPFMPKPCMLKNNGTVDYYLNPDDYTKRENGAASDVTNTAYGGNAMMEWSSIFTKTERVGNRLYMYFCSEKLSGYECYSTKKADGTYGEHFYMPIYEGCVVSGKMRSISTNQKPTVNTTAEQEVTYATANGSGWYTTVWADEDLLRMLGILITGRLDISKSIGYNCGSNTSALTHNCGSANNKGMFYGQASTSAYATKYFGMENWWGHRWRRCNGLMSINSKYFVKLTSSVVDGSTTNGYNRTGSGYINTGVAVPSANNSFIKSMYGLNKGVTMPTAVGGSSTTYYCDAAWSASGTTQLLCGGSVNNGASSGLFTFYVYLAPSGSNWHFGASLSYKSF